METVKRIISDIRRKQFKPIYFLSGEETFYIDKIAEYISEHVLTEEEKGFNQTIVYGKDITIGEIISLARQYPVMSDYQVVVIKEAQDLSKSIDKLEDYFKNIQQSTLLVFCYKYKTIDKRKKIYKLLQENAEFYESKKLKDYQLEGWIDNYLKGKKYQIEPKANAMLCDFIGADLHRLTNELNKLFALIANHVKITAEHIETYIGISKEFNNFEFVNAIAQKDLEKALRIAHYFANNSKNNPIFLTIGLLYNYFSKLLQYHGLKHNNPSINPKTVSAELKINPYALKEYDLGLKNYTMKNTSRNIGVLKNIDLKAKGVNSIGISHLDLLQEMLIKLFV